MSSPGKDPRAAKVAALDRLMAAYEAPLLRYAGRILRDPAAAQDVVQNTFLRFLRSRPRAWEPGPALASWLYRVTHNEAVSHLRRESRRRLLHRRHAETHPTELPPDLGPAARVSDEGLAAARALGRLTLREQQLVILKVYEQKSYKEIGDITGLTGSYIGYLLHHAMRKMAADLRREADNQRGTDANG